MPVALVAGVYRHGGVAQHGFRSGGGDHDVLVCGADYGITNFVDLARRLLVDHFEVGDRGDAARAPVHDVLATIDEAFLVQANERFANGARHAVVHGEVFARPVHRRAEALHLVEDGAAILLPPFPDSRDEGLAAKVAAVLALGSQLAFHHHLGGDAGVIGAG